VSCSVVKPNNLKSLLSLVAGQRGRTNAHLAGWARYWKRLTEDELCSVAKPNANNLILSIGTGSTVKHAHLAHFCPMCLTARNSPPARATLRVLLIMSRTAPTSEVRRVGGPRGAGGPPARATADPPLGGTRTC